MTNCVKLSLKGNNSKGSIDNYGFIKFFVDITLLNIIAVYSLYLIVSIIIFKKYKKKMQNFLKTTNLMAATHQWVV